MFRIPEVRANMGCWAWWSILTVSSSELMVVIFSCLLLYLAVDYICTLHVFPHTKITVEIHESPRLKRRSAPVALILVASDRLCCLTTTGTKTARITRPQPVIKHGGNRAEGSSLSLSVSDPQFTPSFSLTRSSRVCSHSLSPFDLLHLVMPIGSPAH